MTRFLLTLISCLLLATPLHAALNEDDLLPVEEAFVLIASADDTGNLRLNFRIADGYYLYRHRLGLKALDADVTASELQLPTGTQYTDEFFGDVETYRSELAASAPLRWPGDARTTRFEVRFQGCADVGVCYPPHKQIIEVSLPTSAAATVNSATAMPAAGAPAAADNPLAKLLSQTPAPTPLQDDAPEGREGPLPPEQAFVFEAIAFSPTQILARFTMPKGYYLYRDNAAFAVLPADADRDLPHSAPAWPPATPHVDDHFGEVAVFFDQVEVPIDVVPWMTGEPTPFTLKVNFQGCQLDGICYPPMERMVDIDLPAASVEQVAAARQVSRLEFNKNGVAKCPR